MSKQTQSDGFGWDELWSAWAGQPVHIQHQWMMGLYESIEDRTKRSPGLHDMLKEIMERGSKKVRDEVFECAPDDVKKYFGYVPSDTESTKLGYKMQISPENVKRLQYLLRN